MTTIPTSTIVVAKMEAETLLTDIRKAVREMQGKFANIPDLANAIFTTVRQINPSIDRISSDKTLWLALQAASRTSAPGTIAVKPGDPFSQPSSPDSPSMNECTVCHNRIPRLTSITIPCQNSHVWCHDCLYRLLTMAMHPNGNFPPMCCGVILPKEVVARFLSKSIYAAYLAKEADYLCRQASRIICANITCRELMDPNPLFGGLVSCLRCGLFTCNYCHETAHFGMCPKKFAMDAGLSNGMTAPTASGNMQLQQPSVATSDGFSLMAGPRETTLQMRARIPVTTSTMPAQTQACTHAWTFCRVQGGACSACSLHVEFGQRCEGCDKYVCGRCRQIHWP